MSPSLTIAMIAVALSVPILGDVEGEDQATAVAARAVDLVSSQSQQLSSCPEASSRRAEEDIPCWIEGVVQDVLVSPSRVTAVISGQEFHYMVGPKTRWEHGQPLGILVTSKLNRVPLKLRFENWGGLFYITQVNL